MGTMVMTVIIRRELRAVMLTLNSTFRTKMLSITTTMDKPKERAILSNNFIFLKKTRLQAKPGSKKTRINPRSTLRIGKRSKKGRINLTICSIGDNHSMPDNSLIFNPT